ncbi:hypothetical protein [Wolinella succinogenes]|uniref:hypothetical protein n=1 Tax=Wolinella succinogenes TaxID=844 RepID=UPI0024097180|nr:hypothetical protein [Wolinella succinogenes]
MIECLLFLIDALDKITIVFAFVTMIGVIYNHFRQNQKIQIYFLLGGKEIFLENLSIIRRHITRSEILGMLGVIQKNSKERYNIEYLSEAKFFEDLYELQKGGSKKLLIKVTADELEQFSVKNYSEQEA